VLLFSIYCFYFADSYNDNNGHISVVPFVGDFKGTVARSGLYYVLCNCMY